MPPTPESWQHSSRPRSEVATLRRGLSVAAAWGTAVVIAIVALMNLTGAPEPVQLVAVAAAVVLAIIGVAFRSRSWAAWLSLLALVTVVAMGMASPDTRVDLLVMGTYTVIFLALLISSRPWGLAWIAVGVIAMSVIVTRSDLRVDVGGLTVEVGTVAVVQMVVASGWLWWAWHAALDQAARRDARAAEQEQVIVEAVAVQERTRAWRETITRTHETILNDLRYVLRTPQVDRERLRDQLLTTRDRRSQPPSSVISSALALDGITATLRDEFAGEVVLRDLTRGPLDVPWGDIEPAMTEIVRNVSRHTDASRVEITAEQHEGLLRFVIIDNGTSAASEVALPGIGRSVVVGDTLAALGGRVEEAPHRVVIRLPTGGAPASNAGFVLPLIFGIILAGSALGGSVQFLLLLPGASLTYLPVALAACAVTALGVITVARGRPVGMGVVVPAATLAAVVPWGLTLAQPVCAEPPLVLTTINLSLNAFFAILLWARSRWAWVTVVPAVIGVLALDFMPGVGCPLQDADVLLSSAIIIPAALLLSWMSARSTARWEAQDRLLWEAEITESARAEADIDLAGVLGDSIDSAWAQMWEIAAGADLDDQRRRRLRTVESAIRSSLQVDPRYSGGFVMAARQVVGEAGAAGVPIHVRALRGSADPRPLPPEFITGLVDMITSDADSGASLHVFFDGHDDYLTVTLPARVAARAGFRPGDSDDHGCCSIEVDYVEEDRGPAAEVTVIVSRTSSVTPAEPAVVG